MLRSNNHMEALYVPSTSHIPHIHWSQNTVLSTSVGYLIFIKLPCNSHIKWTIIIIIIIILLVLQPTVGFSLPPHSGGYLGHTQWHTTVGRTPLDKWSAHCRDLYLTTHNTYNKHPCPWQDSNPQFQQRSAVDTRLRPLGHWDRLNEVTTQYNYK